MTRCLMQGICFVHKKDCPMQTAGAISLSDQTANEQTHTGDCWRMVKDDGSSYRPTNLAG